MTVAVEHIEDKECIGQIYTLNVKPGKIVCAEKLVTIFSSRDRVCIHPFSLPSFHYMKCLSIHFI